MRLLGIELADGSLRGALRLPDGTIELVPDVKQLDISKMTLITALGPLDTVYREIPIPLRGHRALRAALPFQAEAVIPYPPEETLLVALPSPVKKTVLLIATTAPLLRAHIDQMQQLGLDPDRVSSSGTALAAWGRWKRPDLTDFWIAHRGTCVVVMGGQIVFCQAFDALAKVTASVTTKFPGIPSIPPETEGFDDAVRVGLVLPGGNTVQFRTGGFTPERLFRARKKMFSISAATALLLTMATWGIGSFALRETSHLEATIPILEEQVRSHPKPPGVASVREVLALLGTLDDEVSTQDIHYSLSSPLAGHVTLSIRAKSREAAEEFRKKITALPLFAKEDSWTPSDDISVLSFSLR
jgi:hypothetical protein